MNKEYITKLNEMVDEIIIMNDEGDASLSNAVGVQFKLNQLKGYLSALETLIK